MVYWMYVNNVGWAVAWAKKKWDFFFFDRRAVSGWLGEPKKSFKFIDP